MEKPHGPHLHHYLLYSTQPFLTIHHHCANRTQIDAYKRESEVWNRTHRSYSLSSSFLLSIGVCDCIFRGRRVFSRVFGLFALRFHSPLRRRFDVTDTPFFFSKLYHPPFPCIFCFFLTHRFSGML
ncbi:unnamed protein product [Sphenostylis stenocarpa]|uniref:Uncharacterized protein n=1 Tax=Sphenostylis stenocarpa TaxID=92480 RepID=A0AA86T880_9FABA|nr:unnamed protein product [Sphenostylis stenocarpa]